MTPPDQTRKPANPAATTNHQEKEAETGTGTKPATCTSKPANPQKPAPQTRKPAPNPQTKPQLKPCFAGLRV